MNYLKKLVVVTLLAVWTFPGVSQASPAPAPVSAPPAPAPAASTELTPEVMALANMLAGGTESSDLAAREKQAPNLKDYKGGAVEIYLGSGAVLVLIIILIIILL